MMPDHAQTDAQSVDVSVEDQRALVEKIVNGRTFLHSGILKEFLSYIAEQKIANNLEGMKEQRIGSSVLGRKEDYDPAVDNIVRVRARQLRQKLDEYFAGEGSDEPIIITIPKGHYIPAYEWRARFAPVQTAGAATAGPVSAAPPRRGSRVKTILWMMAAMVAGAALVVSMPWRLPSWSRYRTAGYNRTLWRDFFSSPGQELTIIIADSGLALWQDMTDRTVSLGDYLRRNYLRDGQTDPALAEIGARRYTSAADVNGSMRLAEIARSMEGRAVVVSRGMWISTR